MLRDNGRWRWSVLFVLVAAVIIAADQLTKNWIRFYTGDWPIFELGFFKIIEVHNTGSSFGMFQEQNPVLMAVAAAGIVLILAAATLITVKYKGIDNWVTKLTLGLILGGAAGNFIDRVVYGHVTDFIDVGPWPTFNVADSAMVVGTIILALYILFSPKVRSVFTDDPPETTD